MPRERRVVFLARRDIEKAAGANELMERLADFAGRDISVFTDTCQTRFAGPVEGQEPALEEFWEYLRRSSLVVTDRLHGLIFSVITDTPVLVLDNSTGKVAAFYRTWLRGDPGVRLYGGERDAEEFIRRALRGETPGSYTDLSALFAPLGEELLRAAGG